MEVMCNEEKMKNLFYKLWIGVNFLCQFCAQSDVSVPAGTEAGGNTSLGEFVSKPQNTWMSFLPFILMLGILYLFVLRPQQKKMKEQQNMLSQLKPGDGVILTSGIFGEIIEINDKLVVLEISTNVRIKVIKSQISQLTSSSQVKGV